MRVWMSVAELQPCIILKDLDPNSYNSFPIFISWKHGVVIRNDETGRASLTPY